MIITCSYEFVLHFSYFSTYHGNTDNLLQVSPSRLKRYKIPKKDWVHIVSDKKSRILFTQTEWLPTMYLIEFNKQLSIHLSHVTRLWYFSTHSSNAHAQPSSRARCLIFVWTLCLLPYLMCGNSEGSGETAQMCRLLWAFAGRLCDKYMCHNLMSWLVWPLSGLCNQIFKQGCWFFMSLYLIKKSLYLIKSHYIWLKKWICRSELQSSIHTHLLLTQVHPPSLIRVFAVCSVGSKGPKLSS